MSTDPAPPPTPSDLLIAADRLEELGDPAMAAMVRRAAEAWERDKAIGHRVASVQRDADEESNGELQDMLSWCLRGD